MGRISGLTAEGVFAMMGLYEKGASNADDEDFRRVGGEALGDGRGRAHVTLGVCGGGDTSLFGKGEEEWRLYRAALSGEEEAVRRFAVRRRLARTKILM